MPYPSHAAAATIDCVIAPGGHAVHPVTQRPEDLRPREDDRQRDGDDRNHVFEGHAPV